MPFNKGYGFQNDDIFKKPSNDMNLKPLNVAMDNQAGKTLNLGNNTTGSAFQSYNNTQGSANTNFNLPDIKDDIKQDEMSAGTDDPYSAVEEDLGTTGSSITYGLPGTTGSMAGINLGDDDSSAGTAWDEPLGAVPEVTDSPLSSAMKLQSKSLDNSAGTVADLNNLSLGANITKDPITDVSPEGENVTGPTDFGTQTGTQTVADTSGGALSLGDALQTGGATYTDPYPGGGDQPPPDGGDQGEANTTYDEDTGGDDPDPDPTDDPDPDPDDDPDPNLDPKKDPDPDPEKDPRFGLTDIQRGTDLSTILTGLGYDSAELRKKFGTMFEDYDPTEEGFTERGLGLDEDRLDLAKRQAETALDRATGQAERQQSLLQDQYDPTTGEGYLADTLARQRESLGLRKGLTEDALGYADRSRDIAFGRTGLQRGFLESEIGTIDETTGLRTGGRMAEDLARQQERFGLQEAGLQESAAERQLSITDQLSGLGRQRRGLDVQQGAARGDARSSLFDAYASAANTGGFSGGGARMAASRRATEKTAELYQRQADRTGIAREGIGVQESALDRQKGLVGNMLMRQLDSLALNRDQAQSSYERQQGQLGAQLGGLDLADKSTQVQYDQTSGGLKSQLGQYGIQGKGLTAAFNEQTGKVTSQLAGLQSELGPEGYLQKAYDDQIEGLDLGFQRRELGADVDLFGQRKEYREKVGDRLIDLIQSEADLSGTKTGEKIYDVGATRMGDDGTLDYYTGEKWVKIDEYLDNADQ